MFGMKRLSFAGAGAMGALITGIVASHNWKNGIPKELVTEASKSYIQDTEVHVSIIWRMIFEPLLFGFIGCSLDFDLLQGNLGKSVSVVVIGVSFRLVAAYLATRGELTLTEKERAFIALVWIPKATVQAALCSFPLMLARDVMDSEHQDFDKYILWGYQIVSTAILSILITAPLGLVFIEFLGSKWLTKDEDEHSKVQNNENPTDEGIQNVEIGGHISRINTLLQKVSLSSNKVDQSCALAEIRQALWKCKTALNMQ